MDRVTDRGPPTSPYSYLVVAVWVRGSGPTTGMGSGIHSFRTNTLEAAQAIVEWLQPEGDELHAVRSVVTYDPEPSAGP